MLTAADVHPPAQGSFRDPGGTLYRFPGRILRAVRESHLQDLEDFLATRTAHDFESAGRLVRSTRVPVSEFPGLEADSLWQHESIAFPSFPYEWPPEMLHAAGRLTLDLAEATLQQGFGIKDATPYNVLFRGSQPVFVDLLSFERRDPLDQTWLAYGQFVRTFLLPLLASRHFGLPLDRILSGQRDGLEPETIYRWATWRKRLTPPFLGLVSFPKWLAGNASTDTATNRAVTAGSGPSAYKSKPAPSAEQARFVLNGLYRSLRRQLKSVAPAPAADSTWTGYLDHKSLYTPAQLAQKQRFVEEALDLVRPSRVLDVGANEGRFSLLAARHGAEVVAIDSDPAVVGSIWRAAAAENSNVLPLVVDLTRPTPALGWRNQECASFLDRARGHFDLVLMLAVVHHMLVTERIPLEDLLALADELSKDYVLMQYVAPEDPMFRRIVRGRDELYQNFSSDWFEAAASRRFELVRSVRIDGLHRWLFLFRRRHAAN